MGPDNNGSQHRGDNESNVNHVLLITVFNPHYPITCDIIHQVCNVYGKVNRIVIFKKNGVQAMVEFDNVNSARRAKSSLQGYDIYNGCCTLRVEYAKPTKLNVYKNDQDSFDYTNPNLGTGNNDPNGVQQQASNHGQGHQSHHSASNSHPHHSQHHGHHSRNGPNLSHNHHYHHPHHQHLMHQITSSPIQVGQSQQPGVSSNYGLHDQSQQQEFTDSGVFNMSRGSQTSYANVDSFVSNQSNHPFSRHDGHHGRIGLPGHVGHYNTNQSHHGHHGSLAVGSNYQQQGAVMMVYGLCPDRMNCDKLFNLFCLYGNVARVKFLKSKTGCAMVQMGDYIAVERCLSSLNKVTIFGNELQLSYSKQAFLHDVLQPFSLPDGSPSFKDFMGNKNNRFKDQEAANKNRILPPTPVLHFFNAPFGMAVEELSNLVVQTCEHEPLQLKFFNPKNERNSSGLLTFKDVSSSIEALVLCNHLAIPRPGATHLHILRLCFSNPSNSS